MVRQFEAELQNIRDVVLKMGGFVESALEATRDVLVSRNPKLLEQVRKHEKQVNDLQMKLDEMCVQVLAKQSPVAKDLRLVIAMTKINTDLERMGDQTMNTALYGLEFVTALPAGQNIPKELEIMFDQVRQLVRLGLDSFSKQDPHLSETVLEKDDEVDASKNVLFQMAKDKIESREWSVETGIRFLMVAKNLERLADHVTNIAEDVIFSVTGVDVRHGQGKISPTNAGSVN